MRNKMLRAAIIGNVLFLFVSYLMWNFDMLRVLDRALYDYNMKEDMTNEPHEDIVVVQIDQDSLDLIGTYPWSRDIYVPFLEQVASAKVVAFDIMFPTQSEDPEIDAYFAEALALHDNVIIPSVGETETFFRSHQTIGKDELIPAVALYKSIPEIANASTNAHINRTEDEDSVIRRTWLQLDTPEGVLDSLAFKAAKLYGADVDHYLDYPRSEIHIKYDLSSKDFTNVPFHMVLSGEVPPDFFDGTIVLLGMAAAGDDRGPTPIETMYLVYAHANIINQLLTGEEINVTSDRFAFWIMLVLIAVTLAVTWRMKSVWSVAIVFGLSIGLLYLQYGLFREQGLFINTVYPIAGMLNGFLINIAIKTYFETKQKNFITKQFGRYISPDLVKEIARSDQELQLGGINKELSILFLDIRGFTTLSERLKPEEVVDFLNMMFNLITEKALINHGTIDKFIGDAAMIIFNAPLDVVHHEYYAVKTAYDIQQGMRSVRQDIIDKYGVTISVGIGVNTGEVVVGNIGSYLRVDYTAIGDNVNVAARIESNTVANQILVSETTYEKTQDYFGYNFVGEKMMKGKTVGIKLYEVLEHRQSPK